MNRRHQELVDGYCSGILSDAEFAELEVALRENPSIRETLLEYRALESALRVSAASEAVQQFSIPEFGFFDRWRAQIYTLAATIAILLTGAAVFFMKESSIQAIEEPRYDLGVAVLTRTIEAEWEGEWVPAPGDSIPPGHWKLSGGSAELEFYNGASVILQGPADLEIVSANGGILHSGKLRAQVPEHAHGFTITSRDVELVDLGTAFGMEVDATDGTDVHVFEGSVLLFSPQPGTPRNGGRELLAGEGSRVSLTGGSSSISIEPTDFLSPGELNRRSKEHLQFKYTSWRNEFEESLGKSNLLARYGFEQDLEHTRLLSNSSSNSDPGLVGSIVGARWSTGRWPGKEGLDFKRPSDRVRITVPGNYESMTLATWVRVDGFDYGYCSLLLSDGWDREGSVHWQISKKGYISLAVWNGPDMERHNSKAELIIEPSDFGRWMHLVATYDGASGTVRHYRNGELVGNVIASPVVPLSIDDALIGNWSPAPHSPNQIRNFNGRMDDLAIFSEALSSTEIQALYEAGKP
ncbi:MAG: hypothetical protein HOI15_01655 [Opitutales bacterium]|jgi:hypothetical protein|nr:hypothetical protein [Opitutales bacterium]MBT6769541.1 hypothetical protein [Opitutales bacterium]